MSFDPSLAYAVVLVTSTAALMQLARRRIPDWLTWTASLSGCAFYVLTRGGCGLEFALLGWATGFCLLAAALLLTGAGGHGQARLMGALGALLGARLVTGAILCSAIVVLLTCAVRRIMPLDSLRVFRESPAMENSAGKISRGEWSLIRARRRWPPLAASAAAGVWMALAWL